MPRLNQSFPWQEYLTEQVESQSHLLLQNFLQSQIFPDDLTVSQAQFVALDFETTGLDPEQDEIVSIGLVPFTLNRIKVAQAGYWLVRPECHLRDDSIVIHGITHSDVSNAPQIEDILEQVLSCLEGKLVVVHYQFIEREFLSRAVQRLYGKELLFPMMDTMWLEKALYHDGWCNKLKHLFGHKRVSIRLADSRLR